MIFAVERIRPRVVCRTEAEMQTPANQLIEAQLQGREIRPVPMLLEVDCLGRLVRSDSELSPSTEIEIGFGRDYLMIGVEDDVTAILKQALLRPLAAFVAIGD